MNNNCGKVLKAMMEYYSGDVRRINHFIKVYGFAKTIGEAEGLDEFTQEILELAAVTHDIGIKNSELKYGSCTGDQQQLEGPPEAEKLLNSLGIRPDMTGRICWLIAHHHTYTDISGMDYQILVEADFLVNAHESDMTSDSVKQVKDKIFRTETGRTLLEILYGV